MQRTTLSSSSTAEIMMTGMCRRPPSAFIWVSTSYPFTFGIMISSSTRSNGLLRTSYRAFACRHGNALRAIRGDDHRVAGTRETVLEHEDVVVVVLDVENFHAATLTLTRGLDHRKPDVSDLRTQGADLG